MIFVDDSAAFPFKTVPRVENNPFCQVYERYIDNTSLPKWFVFHWKLCYPLRTLAKLFRESRSEEKEVSDRVKQINDNGTDLGPVGVSENLIKVNEERNLVNRTKFSWDPSLPHRLLSKVVLICQILFYPSFIAPWMPQKQEEIDASSTSISSEFFSFPLKGNLSIQNCDIIQRKLSNITIYELHNFSQTLKVHRYLERK